MGILIDPRVGIKTSVRFRIPRHRLSEGGFFAEIPRTLTGKEFRVKMRPLEEEGFRRSCPGNGIAPQIDILFFIVTITDFFFFLCFQLYALCCCRRCCDFTFLT